MTASFTAPAPQTLTVTGAGTGSGTVTSQAGLTPAINCTITNGVAGGACSQSYPFNTSVTLTPAATGRRIVRAAGAVPARGPVRARSS